MKDWKKILHENGNQKWPGVVIVMSNKITVKADNKYHCIMIKGSTEEKEIIIINTYALEHPIT